MGEEERTTYFAVYNFNDECLELITSNFKYEDDLRSTLGKRINKPNIYTNTGNIISVSVSKEGSTSKLHLECYYNVLSPDDNADKMYVLCLLTEGTPMLDHFVTECNIYGKKLLPMLCDEDVDKVKLNKHVQKWPMICVDYIAEVVNSLGNRIAILLQGALEQKPMIVKSDSEDFTEKLQLFCQVCDMADVLTDNDAPESGGSEPIEVVVSEDGVSHGRSLQTGGFAKQWAKVLSTSKNRSPLFFKQVINNFKLKTIQDLNMLKRLVKDAEGDHYSLYRAYQFLMNSGNLQPLLRNAKHELGTNDVMMVLEDYIESKHASNER